MAANSTSNDGAGEHAAGEVVDLAFDLALAERERHRQDRLTAEDGHRSRRDKILEWADAIFGDRDRTAVEHHLAVDGCRRSRGQQSGLEQIALAGRRELRPVVEVDVLIHDLPDPDHHVVARAPSRPWPGRACAADSSSNTRRATTATVPASDSTSARSLSVMYAPNAMANRSTGPTAARTKNRNSLR